jgi:predicted secreted protein
MRVKQPLRVVAAIAQSRSMARLILPTRVSRNAYPAIPGAMIRPLRTVLAVGRYAKAVDLGTY